MPLSLFGDRNFSISNFAISTMSFTATAMGFPTMLYAQLVRGYSPLESALLFVPMAVMSIVLAPIVGRFTDRVHPRILTGTGFAITAVAIFLLSRTLTADGPVWPILATFALLGIGMAGIWAPLAATATRNLPMQMAGAGSGVYNATRQVGAVLGSAAIAVLLDSRIAAHGLSGGAEPDGRAAAAAGGRARAVQRGDGRHPAAARGRPGARLRVGALLPAAPPPDAPRRAGGARTGSSSRPATAAVLD